MPCWIMLARIFLRKDLASLSTLRLIVDSVYAQHAGDFGQGAAIQKIGCQDHLSSFESKARAP